MKAVLCSLSSLFSVFALALLLVSVRAVPKDVDASPKQPTVFLHIGPSKTGTTYIQSTLSSLKAKLDKLGVCWPAEARGEVFHTFAHKLEHGESVPTFKHNIDMCLDKGQNVIISSEHFTFLEDYSGVKKFFAPYTVHLIAFHREYLNKFYSHYTQKNKVAVNPRSLSDVAFDFMNERSHTMDMVGGFHAIHLFQELFPNASLSVYDYDGILAEGKDIAHVMLCHDLGVLCEESAAGVVPRGKANTKPEMIPYNLLHILQTFLHGLGCKLCMDKDRTEIIRRYSDSSSSSSSSSGSGGGGAQQQLPKLPLTVNTLSAMRHISEQESLHFREEFGPNMLYSNHTAAMIARDAFEAIEVDEHAFFQDTVCASWLRTQIKQLGKEKRICGCGMTVIKGLKL